MIENKAHLNNVSKIKMVFQTHKASNTSGMCQHAQNVRKMKNMVCNNYEYVFLRIKHWSLSQLERKYTVMWHNTGFLLLMWEMSAQKYLLKNAFWKRRWVFSTKQQKNWILALRSLLRHPNLWKLWKKMSKASES